MLSIIKYLITTIFCLSFILLKLSSAQHHPLSSSLLENDNLLKYRSIKVEKAILLPKDIKSLLVVIVEDSQEALIEKPKLKLIGQNSQGDYFDFGDLKFEKFLRPDEAIASFEKKNILHVGSRLRNGFLFWNEYRWDGKKAIWLRTNQYNPRDEFLITLPSATKTYLNQGNIEKAIESLSTINKPYSQVQLGLELLKYIDKVASQMQKTGNITKACGLMEKVFELESEKILIPNFNQIKNQIDYDSVVSSDIENYTLLFSQYIRIVAHYGLLLQKTGKLDKSIEVLNHLASLSPNEPQIYLYLADSYWLSNKKNRAISCYSKYIEIRNTNQENHKIAKRALYRTKASNDKN